MKILWTLTVGAACMVAAGAVFSQTPQSRPYPPNLVARGKYLVENVGTCQDCHTPRNQKGEFVEQQWLQGSPLFVKPAVPMPNWADKSASIAGLPGWTDAQAIKFFMTGIAYNGLRARPPMPQYRFSRADATAVVAYLRSLKPANAGHNAISQAAGTPPAKQ